MSKLTLAATLTMILTIGFHVFGGGAEIMTPVLASSLPETIISVIWVVWHGITTILIAIAIALAWLTKHENNPLLAMICFVMLGFTALFIVAGLQIESGLIALPQWIIFSAITLMALLGARARSSAS